MHKLWQQTKRIVVFLMLWGLITGLTAAVTFTLIENNIEGISRVRFLQRETKVLTILHFNATIAFVFVYLFANFSTVKSKCKRIALKTAIYLFIFTFLSFLFKLC